MSHDNFRDCIQACGYCATACSQCAVACLGKDAVELAECIRLNIECTALCRAAMEIMSIESEYSIQLCQLCADTCSDCALECEKHAKMGMLHCRECAIACRRCAATCNVMTGI